MSLLLTGAGKPGSVAAAPFDPLSLSPAFWFKADAGTNQTVAGAAAVADGDPVGEWQDQSGNVRHASQATGSKRPTLKLAIQNGKPVLRFSEAALQYLQTALFGAALAQPSTIFVAAPLTTTGMLFDGGAAAQNTIYSEGGIVKISGGAVLVSALGAPVAWSTWGAIFNGVSSSLRRDQSVVIAGNAGTNSMSRVTIAIDQGFSTNYYHDGDIGEIIGFNSLLSGANITLVENYLKGRWGTP